VYKPYIIYTCNKLQLCELVTSSQRRRYLAEELEKGFRSPLSSVTFYIEELVREAIGNTVKTVRFANNQAMVAATQEGLRDIMTVLCVVVYCSGSAT